MISEAALEYQEGNRKEWIIEETWASMEERSRIRAKIFDSKSVRIRERIKKENNSMIVRKNPDEIREPSLIYWLRKQNRLPTNVIWMRFARKPKDCAERVKNDRHSSRIVKVNTYHGLWRSRRQGGVQHFKSVLDQPCTLNTLTNPPASKNLEISVGIPTVKEVKDANQPAGKV